MADRRRHLRCAPRPAPPPDPSEVLHVVPIYGPEHDCSTDCWCSPYSDREEPRVLVHREAN